MRVRIVGIEILEIPEPCTRVVVELAAGNASTRATLFLSRTDAEVYRVGDEFAWLSR